MPAGTISVAAGANAYEGGAAGSFVLSRTDTTAGQSVNFSFGGTASSSDYAQPLMAYFDVGQASITLTIPAADDSISEPTETIVFTLTPGADYTVGASGSATIDLIDNDPAAPPLVGIAALGVTTAGGPVGTFRITRADPTGPLTVNYVALTTAGGVSYAVPASASFAAGQAWADLVVTPTEGADPAQMISVTITLTPGTGYAVGPAGMATLNLYANEVSVAKIADAYEGGASGGFRLTRTGDLSQPLTVNYSVDGGATSGTDYTALDETVTFAAGSATASVDVEALTDNASEPTEAVVLALSSGSDYTAGMENVATVNILDTGAQVVTVAKIADAAEDGAIGTFQFTRTGDLSQELTVTYTVGGTATPGDDYTALSGTITFPAYTSTTSVQSASSSSVDVTAFADGNADPDETVVVTVASGVGYTVGTESSATITIADETAPTLIDQQTFQLTGANGEVYVTLTVTYNVAGAVGLYTWAYAVTNPSANDVTLTNFGVAVTGDDVANLASSLGWTGTIGASGVSWLAGTGLAPGTSATFSFTTEPREVGYGIVSAGNAGGFLAALPVAPAPAPREKSAIYVPDVWWKSNPDVPLPYVPVDQALIKLTAEIRKDELVLNAKEMALLVSRHGGGFPFSVIVTGKYPDTDSLQAAVRWSNPGNGQTDVGHATNATPLRNGAQQKRAAGATWTLDEQKLKTATWATKVPTGATHFEVVMVYTDTIVQPPNRTINDDAKDKHGADLPIIVGSFSGDLKDGKWEITANLDLVEKARKGHPPVEDYKGIIEKTKATLAARTGYELRGRPEGLDLTNIKWGKPANEQVRTKNQEKIEKAVDENIINERIDTGFDIIIRP